MLQGRGQTPGRGQAVVPGDLRGGRRRAVSGLVSVGFLGFKGS